MNEKLVQEIECMKLILHKLNLPFQPTIGARIDKIEAVEKAYGLVFDEYLRKFYQFSNGSDHQTWLLVPTDAYGPSPCRVCSLEEAQHEYDFTESLHSQGQLWNHIDDPRDERIRPNILHHEKWFPIAKNNNYGSTIVYFDAAPMQPSDYGQIIVYEHDPDGIYYVAQSFLELLRVSNNTWKRA